MTDHDGAGRDVLLAVDGGNAKTDLALVSGDGAVLALVRGPGSSPHEHGLEGALDRIEALLEEARLTAGGPELAIADLSLAGVDFAHEVAQARRGIEERGWARRVEVGNDTQALLRAGTDRGWGEARFPALGETTGDWGGGYDLGRAAVFAAARSEDGRGPRTSLEQSVAAHFGFPSLLALAEAVHLNRLSQRRFVELAPLVFAEAPHDPVAGALVDRLAGEIVSFVRVALERIGPLGEPVDVVLGGGILRARHPRLLDGVEAGLHALGVPHAIRIVDAPPVVGAALLGLDRLGAPEAARQRVRRELAPEMAEVSHG
jgi:N-acetylglucosamine kinase-like BadF-type ATPase